MWILLGFGLVAMALAKSSNNRFIQFGSKPSSGTVDIDLMTLQSAARDYWKDKSQTPKYRYIISFITNNGRVMADSFMGTPNEETAAYLNSHDAAWVLYDTTKPDWLNNYLKYKRR
jgi:hypothetical protein